VAKELPMSTVPIGVSIVSRLCVLLTYLRCVLASQQAYSGAVNRLTSPKNRIKSRVKIVKFLLNRLKSRKIALTRQHAFCLIHSVYVLKFISCCYFAGKSCNPGVLQSKVIQHG
jgi:hypothetical protein